MCLHGFSLVYWHQTVSKHIEHARTHEQISSIHLHADIVHFFPVPSCQFGCHHPMLGVFLCVCSRTNTQSIQFLQLVTDVFGVVGAAVAHVVDVVIAVAVQSHELRSLATTTAAVRKHTSAAPEPGKKNHI